MKAAKTLILEIVTTDVGGVKGNNQFQIQKQRTLVND